MRLNKARAAHTICLALECDFWHNNRQSSGFGREMPTIYFHSIVCPRRNKNYFGRLKERDGSRLEDANAIKTPAVNFFSSLFGDDRDIIPLTEIPFHFYPTK